MKKLATVILALLLASTQIIPCFAYNENSDFASYKDYIAIELNSELHAAMANDDDSTASEYAGAYIDEFGNYHVCVTQPSSISAFEEILDESTVSSIEQEALVGAQLSRSEKEDLQSTQVIYDIKDFSYDYLEEILNILTDNMVNLGIHQVAIKQRDNVVDIFTEQDCHEEIQAFLNENIQNFDVDSVRFNVEENTQTFLSSSSTVIPYSGHEIICDNNGSLSSSTIGFHVQDFWGYSGIIVAGHAASDNSDAYYSGDYLGTTESSSLSGKLDCAYIPFSDDSSVTWETSEFVNEEGTSIYSGLSPIATEDRIVEGARTERYGIISGKTYGTIENTSVSFTMTYNGSTKSFNDFVRINDPATQGDSGGTVGLRANTAKAKLYLLGITSSGSGSMTNVCKASNIVDAYGLEAVTY